METGTKAKRLRIYISSTDKYEKTPLYELVVFSAKKEGVAGATVLKGIMGYGASSEIYSNKVWELTEKVPLVIEIVDEPGKVDSFLGKIRPFFAKSGKGHIITMEETTVMIHKAGMPKK